MKFDCDKWKYKLEWHRWFAWYPVKVADRDCRWLEYVERKGTLYAGFDGSYWGWEYRLIDET